MDAGHFGDTVTVGTFVFVSAHFSGLGFSVSHGVDPHACQFWKRLWVSHGHGIGSTDLPSVKLGPFLLHPPSDWTPGGLSSSTGH